MLIIESLFYSFPNVYEHTLNSYKISFSFKNLRSFLLNRSKKDKHTQKDRNGKYLFGLSASVLLFLHHSNMLVFMLLPLPYVLR